MWLPQKGFDKNKRGDWRRQWPKLNLTLNKRWNWNSCKKFALTTSWTHGLIAQLFRVSEQNSMILDSNFTRASFLYLLQRKLQWSIPYVSADSAIPMWLPQENFNEMKFGDWRRQSREWNMTLKKGCYWRSFTKLALRASWTDGPIAQSVKGSERNSMIVGLNPTWANFV